ncbi:MAG: hypothetical protein ACOH5I_09225 [Oligoflexus sp.]
MTDYIKKLSPRNLVLELLQARGKGRSMPVQSLISVAELFGYAGSVIRVTVTRLAAEGYLSNPARGSYCLAAHTDHLFEHLNLWRLGEQRMRAWDRRWIIVLLPKNPERKLRRKTMTATKLFGLQKAQDNLLVRPHNLSVTLDQFKTQIRNLGLEEDAAIFLGSDVDVHLEETWYTKLWDIDTWARRHLESRKKLEESQARLEQISLAAAAKESFLLGRAALHLLVTDPLLPKEIASAEARQSHTSTMHEYDRKARELWQVYLQSLETPVLEALT